MSLKLRHRFSAKESGKLHLLKHRFLEDHFLKRSARLLGVQFRVKKEAFAAISSEWGEWRIFKFASRSWNIERLKSPFNDHKELDMWIPISILFLNRSWAMNKCCAIQFFLTIAFDYFPVWVTSDPVVDKWKKNHIFMNFKGKLFWACDDYNL